MLSVAVLEGDLNAVYEYIFNDADVEECNDVGNRPLHAAAFTGNVPIARLLIKAGASVHARNDKGRTPLHVASCEDRGRDMVQFLLECGADPQSKDLYKKTPRDYASPQCAIPMDEWLLARWDQSLCIEDNPSPRSPFSRSFPSPTTSKGADAADALLAALSKKAASEALKPSQMTPPSPIVRTVAKPPVAAVPVLLPLTAEREVDYPPPPPPLPSSAVTPYTDAEAEEDDSRPFVEIDGLRVYIPLQAFSPAPPFIKENDLPADNNKLLDQGIDYAWSEITIRIRQPSGGESLGMLLSANNDAEQVMVENLHQELAAFKSGIRIGDCIVAVNGEHVGNLAVEEIPQLLSNGGREGGLEITVARKLPRLIVEQPGELGWSKQGATRSGDGQRFAQLFFLMQALPDCLNEDECFKLIHSFQEAIALFRKGEASMELVDAIQTHLGNTNADVVERAAHIVTHAVQQMQSREE